MAKKPRKRKRTVQVTGVADHTRSGKVLSPPLLTPVSAFHSWLDERLPEILWAVLIVGQLPRDDALAVFRDAASYLSRLPEEQRFPEVTHSALAKLDAELRRGFIAAVCGNDAVRQAWLRSGF